MAKDQVERLRTQFLTGLAIRAQDTDEMSSLAFDAALFPNHPYGLPEDGYTETIQAIQVDDLAAVYQAAELLLMPSRQEGLGIVALEAMACGTPVVARECGGIDRILSESGGGVVAKTSEGFAKAIDDLLNDSDQARSMGESGRRWVEANASRSSLLRDPNLFRL